MKMIYDPIRFVMLVEKNLVGNFEPIMRICGKIFAINLHNLQMLFMLWIKNKFSECLATCTNMKVPKGRLSGDGFPSPADTGGIPGQLAQISFVPPNFVVLRKICLKHMIKIKIFPP